MRGEATLLDPADVALLADGAMTVRQAAVFSGISRTELFDLMKQEIIEWFPRGKNRLIVRKSLVEYLARLYAAHKLGAK